MSSRRILGAVAVLLAGTLRHVDSQEAGDVGFATLHRRIKPGAGESRWMEIAWHPSVWEARRQAAAEGKPLFILAGSGGAPAAGC